MEEKRLFLAFDIFSPWIEEEPKGRYIDKNFRHLTLIFLGNVKKEKIDEIISKLPIPSFQIGAVGIFDKILFIPHFHPRVVAFNINWLILEKDILEYRKDLISFFKKLDILVDEKPFLSHVTVARKTFDKKSWKKNFIKLPLAIKKINLYESLKNSNYQSLFSYDLISPFEELEHTADIAFKINGYDYNHLFINGFIALCFKFFKFIEYFPKKVFFIKNIDDVIIELNDLISRMDSEIGSPFKAVSFQANVVSKQNYLEWEMVVDV
ncbi:MAG: hypothetical protein AMS24_02325 [Chlamydiae bacterium SM23_39]|nr:MAG: hypothetical protein AMS24_02325 [Chlamydiae bacterium SM23_39]